MPPASSSLHRLLVEGPDDQHTIIHLLLRHGFDWDDPTAVRPYIQASGGVDRLLEEVPVTLKGPYERVGVVVDSDLDLTDRWAQLRHGAARVGIALPVSPEPGGTIVDGLRPGSKIGFWLMPDNSSPGMLENFLRLLIPPDDPCGPYAGEAVTEARRRGAPCKEKDHAKSVLYSWLAWQEEPGLPFGTALKARIFTHDSEAALLFVGWFRRLFADP